MESAPKSRWRLPWTLFGLVLGALPAGCGGAPAPASGLATGLVGTWALSAPGGKQQISFAADGTVTLVDDTGPGAVGPRGGTYAVSGQDLTITQQQDGAAPTQVTSPFYQYMDHLVLYAYYPEASHQGLVGTWLNRTVTEVLDPTAPATTDLRTTYLFLADGMFSETQALYGQGSQHSGGTWSTASASDGAYSLSYGTSSTPGQVPIYLVDETVVATQVYYRSTASASP